MKKFEINDILQWTGAPLIITGHTLNAIGPNMYPWNILVFFWVQPAFLLGVSAPVMSPKPW